LLPYSFLYQIVWLKEFKTFKDKSSAINQDTGVNGELTGMIMRCCHPSRTLAVGNMESKRIIEKSLPVRCLFNETVMEAMWGLKNLMHVLVPAEKLELTKKDRLPMSQGLKWLMDRHGFGVKPEMVSSAVDFLDVSTLCFVVYVFIYCDTIMRVFGSLPWFATTNIRHATQYKPAPWFMQKLR